MDLVITGTVGLDDVKTPFGEVKKALGGSGIYASAAASFFAKPGLVSIMGTDMPRDHLNLLKKRKIDLSGVEVTGETFAWSGFYEYDMNEAKTLKTDLNSLLKINPALTAQHKDAQFIFLANIDPAVQLEVLNQANKEAFVVVDTMNYWISSKKEMFLKVLNRADIIVMNEGEARQLFNTPNLIIAGKKLLKLGPKFAIIKKGEHGALLFSKDKFFSAPGYPLEAVNDPTGAGDSFAGGLIGYLAKTNDLSEKNIRKAVIYGSVIASFCAEDFSLNYLNNINIKLIKERYNALKEIRRF